MRLNVQKMIFSGTDPSSEIERSRLDVNLLTEVETAGGVMKRPIERQELATS